MKRSISLIIAAIIVTTLFAGCGQPKAEQATTDNSTIAASSQSNETNLPEPAKLSGNIVFTNGMTNVADTTITALAKDFMEKNPGTDVQIEAVGNYDDILMTRLAAGESPDIFTCPSKIKSKKYPDFFLPIDDIGYNRDNIYFYDSYLGPDNRLYALPDAIAYFGVIYNKKAFAEAGIGTPPKTMDELTADCELLKAKGITPIGTAFKDVWPLYAFETQENWNASFNGDTTGENSYIDKDEFIDDLLLKGLNTMRDFNKKGYFEKDLLSAGWDQMKKDIGAGKIAMYYAQSWFAPQVVENGAAQEDVGMFPWPETKYTPVGGTEGIAISKDTKYPELAKAFLKYLMQDGNYCKACGALSPVINTPVTDLSLKELLSYNLPIVATQPTNYEITAALNKAELDIQKAGQEYIIVKDDAAAAKIVKDFNDKWAAVRKQYGGK